MRLRLLLTGRSFASKKRKVKRRGVQLVPRGGSLLIGPRCIRTHPVGGPGQKMEDAPFIFQVCTFQESTKESEKEMFC